MINKFKKYSVILTCNTCFKKYNINLLPLLAQLYGVIFLVGEKQEYIGFTCPSCMNTTLLKTPVNYLKYIFNIINQPTYCNIRIIENGHDYLKKSNDEIGLNITYSNTNINVNINLSKKYYLDVLFLDKKLPFGQLIYKSYPIDHLFLSKLNIENNISVWLDENTFFNKLFRSDLKQMNKIASYFSNSRILEHSSILCSFDEKDIFKVVKYENDNKIKIFPRYYYMDNFYLNCISFCNISDKLCNSKSNTVDDITIDKCDRINRLLDIINSNKNATYAIISLATLLLQDYNDDKVVSIYSDNIKLQNTINEIYNCNRSYYSVH